MGRGPLGNQDDGQMRMNAELQMTVAECMTVGQVRGQDESGSGQRSA